MKATQRTSYPWKFGVFLGMYYMANGVYQGYASKYFESKGLTTMQMSIILAFTPLIAIVMQPVWGAVGDRAKRRNTVLLMLTAVSSILVLLYRISDAFWYLLPMSMLFSALYTSIQPMGDSIILEDLTPKRLAFGPLRLYGTYAFAVTNPIWGLILSPERMNWIVYLTSFMLMITVAAVFVLPPTEGHQSKGKKMNILAVLKVPHMAGLLLMLMLLQLTYGYFYSFYSIFYTSLPGSNGIMLGICYFLSAVSETPFLLNEDKLFKKLGAGKLMVISAVVLTLRWTILGFTNNPYVAMASQVLHGWGFIVMTVSTSKFVAKVIPDELKASGQMALSVVGFGIARAFGILGGGAVASVTGSVQNGFRLTACVALITLLVFAPKYLPMKPLNGQDE